jgi:hypothetical protein
MSDDSLHPLPSNAVARLMCDLLDSLRANLREPVTALFDALDDTLFEMGEHARSGETQQHHFDALRECRRQRGVVQEQFLAALGQSHAAEPDKLHPSHAQMSLVAPEDLEEELALDAMATRSAQRLAGGLHALNQRIGWLLCDTDIDDQRNPFGPLQIGKAFRSASEILEIDLQARLVLYKIFERQVLGALDRAYVELNTRLAAVGVLPMLGQSHGRQRAAPLRREPPLRSPQTPASASPVQVQAAVNAPVMDAPAFATHDRDLLAAMRALLARDIEVAALASVAPAAPATSTTPSALKTATATEVMDGVLARLRARPLSGQPSPRQLSAQLLAEARYSDFGLPPSPQQAATVDIVGRVFDVLANDQSVPQRMQPVMQTLLLPVMRASLRYPGLLAENNHPLRQLIDLIGESAIGWCPSVDPGERALKDLQTTLQKIAGSETSEDADRTISQLRSQLEQQRRRSELAEHRAVEAHAGRERLWQARRQVNQALIEIVARAPVPTWVRYLVTHPWMNCLVLLWLRQGADSQAYREALGFAESLVWCANAGSDRIEQLRLRALLPVMEVQLRQGLATVAYQETEIRQLVNELQQYVRYRIGDLPAPAFIETAPPAANAPGAMTADPASIEEQPLPQDVDPAVLARVHALRPGAWVAFGDQAKGNERARLSWVSPYSGRCMFVNRNGLKVCERRPEDLAHAIEKGGASILENTQLLHRALAQVLAQLQDDAQAKRA